MPIIKKITMTGHSSNWNLYSIDADECCDGCAQVVEFNPSLNNNQMLTEPYVLQNGHKLCSECLEEWIKLPKGFIDKFLLVSQYNMVGGDLDDFIDKLNLTQQDIDSMIQEWNNKKKQGLLEFRPNEIKNAESHFEAGAGFLGLKVNPKDFI